MCRKNTDSGEALARFHGSALVVCSPMLGVCSPCSDCSSLLAETSQSNSPQSYPLAIFGELLNAPVDFSQSVEPCSLFWMELPLLICAW